MKKPERIDSLSLNRKSKRNQLGHPMMCPNFMVDTYIMINTSPEKNIFYKQIIMEGKANHAIAYEEFEPFCKWQRNKDLDVLEIHLQGFKKEQLKVQISNLGILKISGERQLDASRKSKFYKEVQIASTYEASTIHAKFVNNWLHITMPKRKAVVPENNGKRSPEASKIDRTSKPELITEQSRAAPSSSGGAMEKIQTSGEKSPAAGAIRRRKCAAPVAVTLAAAVAALIALVVYVYKLKIDDERCLSW